MSVPPIQIACSCGTLQISLTGATARSGTHAVCYCTDCQAFARTLGHPDVMDAQGGTDLYQSQPDKVTVVSGADHLAVLQLRQKGLYRWYASCCNTPLCNTMGTAKMPFASFLTANFKGNLDQIGGVKFRHKPDRALGPVTQSSGPMWKFAFRALKSMLIARTSGRWRNTPFFDVRTGRSITKPRVLTEAERAKAYKPT